MESKIIRINELENFIVHFKDEGRPDHNMSWSGTVAQIQMYDDTTWLYMSKSSCESTDNLENARVWFEWSIRWVGVWDMRVYLKQEEMWGAEIETIPLIWKQIEAIVKKRIKADNPDEDLDD